MQWQLKPQTLSDAVYIFFNISLDRGLEWRVLSPRSLAGARQVSFIHSREESCETRSPWRQPRRLSEGVSSPPRAARAAGLLRGTRSAPRATSSTGPRCRLVSHGSGRIGSFPATLLASSQSSSSGSASTPSLISPSRPGHTERPSSASRWSRRSAPSPTESLVCNDVHRVQTRCFLFDRDRGKIVNLNSV